MDETRFSDTLAADALRALRAQVPLVQCITNFVAMTVAANSLIAAGAAPAMVHTAEEAGDFAAVAQALTVNIGTLSPPWLAGMDAAITGAAAAGRPWVLDPVAHFATPFRSAAAQALVARRPTIVRGNASEILAFSGASAGRGVDAGDAVAAAVAAARALAACTGGVVAVTGAEDYVTDGGPGWFVRGGSPLMAQVTATGCSLTAVMGGFAAVVPPVEAAIAALLLFAVAGEAAAAQADGPGSFAWRFLDALAATQPEALEMERVRAA